MRDGEIREIQKINIFLYFNFFSQASENFPETALKIFRIPKKTSSSSPPPLPHAITLSFTSPKPTTTRTTRHTNQHHRKIQHSLIIEEQQLLEEREEERRREETSPLDSHCLQRLELGLPTNVNGIHYEIKNDEGQSWNGSDLKGIILSLLDKHYYVHVHITVFYQWILF